LVFFSASSWAGSVTMNVRQVNAKWSANKVNWNNDPGAIGVTASLAKTGAGKGTRWEVDITAVMQQAANGTPWYGLRLNASGAAQKAMFSMQAVAKRRPYVVITWSDNPLPPADLVPRSGMTIGTPSPVFSWDFIDYSGNRAQAAYQLQIDNDNTFATPIVDTGITAGTIPQHDIALNGFAATSGVTYYWRVTTQDGAGLWSGWSAIETFKYEALGTLDITNPSAVNPWVSEPTPVIGWNPSITQSAYQVMLYDEDSNALLWDSGKVTSTNDFATVPAGRIKTDGKEYRVVVRSWDNLSRITVPGFPAYVEAERVFTYEFDPTVDGVTDLVVALDSLGMAAEISFERAIAPDSFVLMRDDAVIRSNIQPIDIQDDIDPTLYHILDFAPGRKESTWKVVAVVNGSSSEVNPTATVNLHRTFSWICSMEGELPVALADPDFDTEDGETSAVMQALGSDPILVTQNLFGETGSVSARLATGVIPTLAASQMKQNLRDIRSMFNGHCRLMFSDESWEVYIHSLSVNRVNRHDGTTEYEVGFEFFQVNN
jgi:hypothetical protein